MIHGVVFDMDGLMFDTERLALESWRFAGAQAGYDFSEAVIVETVGLDVANTKRVFLERLGADLDFDNLRKIRFQYVKDFIQRNGVPLKPGLFELLEYLKRNHYKATVATSTEAVHARYYLEKAGVIGYFAGIVCGDAVGRGKPAPDIYQAAAGILGLVPGECLALEDSPSGVLSACRAGMKPVMIPDLVRPDEATQKLLYAQVPSLSDVIALLEQAAGRPL